MTRRTTSIRLQGETLERLDHLARSLDRSRSWLLNQAVERYLDHEEWFVAGVEEGLVQAERAELIPHDRVMDRTRARIATKPNRRS